MNRRLFVFTFICIFLIHPMTMAASPWPASSGTDFSDALYAAKSTLEPSGMVWHATRDQFLVVGDEGEICTLSSDGATATCTKPASYDLEGITIADNTTNKAYTGVELIYRSATDYDILILEYDLDTQSYTGNQWNLADAMPASSNTGMEALTFVPNGAHPYTDSASGGVFYAGSQYDGKIYVFDVNLSSNGSVSFVDTITVDTDYTDLADLYYSDETELVYASYDGNNRLVEINASGAVVTKYEMAGDNQEAFSLVADCATGTATVYIGQDAGSSVGPVINEYTNYPITCVGDNTDDIIDNDTDGVDATIDCNDNDASISANKTYYADADGDGLGNTAAPTSVCSNTAPAGYVTDNTDANDSDYDNDGMSSSSDCDDHNSAVSTPVTYYADKDADGLGDAASTTTACSTTAPTGYVSNSSDTNDSGTTTTTTSKIEIYGNSIDDDGDGKVDEYNTVSENGYHPTYSDYDPSSSSTYKSTVKSISGTTNGDILVKYADNSIYQYDIYSTTTSKTSKVYSWYSTGYLYVFNPSSSWKYVWVNAYTGKVY